MRCVSVQRKPQVVTFSLLRHAMDVESFPLLFALRQVQSDQWSVHVWTHRPILPHPPTNTFYVTIKHTIIPPSRVWTTDNMH